MVTKQPTPMMKRAAKIQTFKRKGKVPIPDITLPAQTVQLQGENETLRQEILDLKAKIILLESDKCIWEQEKQDMQGTIDKLKDYDTPEVRSPTDEMVKAMSDVSLKDLEISQLKEANQQL